MHAREGVTIRAAVKVEGWSRANLQVHLKVTSPTGQAQTAQGEPSDCNGNLTCDLQSKILKPQLWWPNGFGKQPLYQVELSLQSGQTVLDQRTYQVGLRSLELRQEPDEWGQSFTFVVNGVPVFAKGADWIPANSLPTRISDEQMQGLIRDAAAANMNMLRVWGGGFYEADRFYEMCDRYGLLVWQDFIFACGIYPEDAAFAENVRVEAIENVRRLRHHACLALWCGNNEMEQGWVDWKWNDPQDPVIQSLKAGYDRMFHHLLPEVVAAEDPDRPYWPSSASSGVPFSDPNGQQRGDTHYWDVWHGRKPFSAYREQFPRFMSEFGFQALPPYKTVQTYAGAADQNMTSYVMEHHQRSGSGNGLMIGQMTDTFRMHKDFQSLVYLSMVLQAEGIRYGVEHWRRNRHARQRDADLAIERLLAGGLLVEYRLFRALEGAALCRPQVLRADFAQRGRPGRKDGTIRHQRHHPLLDGRGALVPGNAGGEADQVRERSRYPRPPWGSPQWVRSISANRSTRKTAAGWSSSPNSGRAINACPASWRPSLPTSTWNWRRRRSPARFPSAAAN